jgi:hypothetical protein
MGGRETAVVSRKSIREKERYANDPEFRSRKQARARGYLAAHKDEINARKRERLRTDPEFRERSRAYHRHGLSTEDYHAILARQGGACAICKRKGDREPGVDHCHLCRQLRGLLCSNCNVGLGHYCDDTGRLLAAIAYLEASRRGIDELVPAIAAKIAERLRKQLERELRAAFALRRGAFRACPGKVGTGCPNGTCAKSKPPKRITIRPNRSEVAKGARVGAATTRRSRAAARPAHRRAITPASRPIA